MEYLAGYLDGEAWLEAHGPLPLAQGLALGTQVLQALAVAHAAGVVHRNLKPAILLLKDAGGDLSVKVIDFGLARIAPRTEATRVLAATRRGGLSQLGTAIAGTRGLRRPRADGRDAPWTPGSQEGGKREGKERKRTLSSWLDRDSGRA